jgi:desulfoferrodoxin (superoxide reductase-like protein)
MLLSSPFAFSTLEVAMTFVLLKDPGADTQLLVRNDHISAVEVKKEDQAVTVYLRGGQTLHLTPEQAKQFVHHIKVHLHPAH